MKSKRLAALALTGAMMMGALTGCGGGSAMSAASGGSGSTEVTGDTVKVGILHSLSGTMAMSEEDVVKAEEMAIQEINDAGGVLGKQIEAVKEDGASDPQTFAEKARKLLQSDQVSTIFGCWTSASRKAVKPVVEENNGLLWYPVQYEGMEASDNIMYMGAAPNQQAVPAVEYLLENVGKKVFLVGSDYVFPRTANMIINAQLKAQGGECVGEEYTPMGHTDYATIISKIKEAQPDVIINTLNGDSNVSFFKQLKDAGITSDSIPVMSFSIAEVEVAGIGADVLEGNYTSWNYYQTTNTEANKTFVENYRKFCGDDTKVTDDPIEAAYVAVHMWAMACEKAGSFDVDKVRTAAAGLTYDAPEGTVTIDGDNQHLYKTVRIGKINAEGLIDEVWASDEPIKPDPYLETYDWASDLSPIES